MKQGVFLARSGGVFRIAALGDAAGVKLGGRIAGRAEAAGGRGAGEPRNKAPVCGWFPARAGPSWLYVNQNKDVRGEERAGASSCSRVSAIGPSICLLRVAGSASNACFPFAAQSVRACSR